MKNFFSEQEENKTAEMRFLRPVAGYTLWDKKKRSSNIRKLFGIFNINDKLTQLE
jgi:hypothetical protein